MSAAVRRVIDADDGILRQQPLNPEIPLIDLGVTCGFGPLIVVIPIAPLGQLAVLLPLRAAETGRNGFSSVAYCVWKPSKVKKMGESAAKAGPAYWKLVATLIP